MRRNPLTIPQIRREGFQALLERLGPADALRFLQQFEPGRGDYTRERDSWLQDTSIDALAESIERRRHPS